MDVWLWHAYSVYSSGDLDYFLKSIGKTHALLETILLRSALHIEFFVDHCTEIPQGTMKYLGHRVLFPLVLWVANGHTCTLILFTTTLFKWGWTEQCQKTIGLFFVTRGSTILLRPDHSGPWNGYESISRTSSQHSISRCRKVIANQPRIMPPMNPQDCWLIIGIIKQHWGIIGMFNPWGFWFINNNILIEVGFSEQYCDDQHFTSQHSLNHPQTYLWIWRFP